MKQLKYKVTGLMGILALLAVSSEISEDIVKYSAMSIAFIGIVILSNLITKDITEFASASMASKESNIEKFAIELKDIIEKYNGEQGKNTLLLIDVVDRFSDSTKEYMDKVDSLVTIQNTIIEEGKSLIGEVHSLNTDIRDLLEEFCLNINGNLSETITTINKFHQSEEKILKEAIESISKQNEKFCSDFSASLKKANENEIENLSIFKCSIEEYMNKYELILDETKDSLNALKSQVKVSLEQANKAILNQTTSIEDGLENCTDEIEIKLGEFSKDQKNRDNAQNAKLNEEVKSIELVVSSKTEEVLEANRKLIEYVQKVQEEWTSLSRDEIAFLSKVWDE